MERRTGLYGALSQAQMEEAHMIQGHDYPEEHQDLEDAQYMDYMQWEGEGEGEEQVHDPSNGHVLIRRDEQQGEEYADEEFNDFVEFNDEDDAKRYITKMHVGDLIGAEEELIEENEAGPSQYIHEEEFHDPDPLFDNVIYQPTESGNRLRRQATIHNCEVCGAVLKHPSKIAAHMRTHTGERPFQCSVCGRTFTQRTPWRMHMKRHARDLPFLCSSGCGKAFPNASQRNAHDLRHIGRPRQGQPRPHLKPQKRRMIVADPMSEVREAIMDSRRGPPVVDAQLFELSDDAHKRIDEVISAVAENRPVRQIPASKPVPDSTVVAATTASPRIRTRRAPPIVAECHICGLLLKHPSKIQAHMRSHTGVKPFKCTLCGLSVATFYALRMHHRRRHIEGERPLACTWECGRRFVSVSAKNEHERIVHAGIKRYVCSVGDCCRLFSRRNHLIAHRLRDHPGLVHVDEYDDAVDLDYEEVRELMGLDEEGEEGEEGEEAVETHHIEEDEQEGEVEAVDDHGIEEREEGRGADNVFRQMRTSHQMQRVTVKREVTEEPAVSVSGRMELTPSPPPSLTPSVPSTSVPPQELSLPRAIPVVPRVNALKMPRIVRPRGSGMH